MDIARLDQMVQFYFTNGIAASTRRSYSSAQLRYLEFCSKHQHNSLPLSESTLCQYVAYLANEAVSQASIKSYLSALRQLQIAHSMHDPRVGDMCRLQQVLRGIKSIQAQKGAQPRVRLPITPHILCGIRRVLETDARAFNNIMLWAACTLCFFGFLRSGEATISSGTKFDAGAHLTVEDLSVDVPANPTSIRVVIKASKTDPFRKGVAIVIGRTDNPICPVTAMMAYLAVRGMNQGPLFRCQDGSPLTRDSFVQRVKQTLKKAGFDSSQYAGHSFRIGAATTAAACGIQDSLIKTLGRWESSAYLAYVKIPRETLAGVSHRLAIGDR